MPTLDQVIAAQIRATEHVPSAVVLLESFRLYVLDARLRGAEEELMFVVRALSLLTSEIAQATQPTPPEPSVEAVADGLLKIINPAAPAASPEEA